MQTRACSELNERIKEVLNFKDFINVLLNFK